MTESELRQIVVAALVRVAPEADPGSLDTSANLRDQLDIDSMDFLRFIVAIHDRVGVEIPEADYGRLSTIDAIVKYLRAGGSPGQGGLRTGA